MLPTPKRHMQSLFTLFLSILRSPVLWNTYRTQSQTWQNAKTIGPLRWQAYTVLPPCLGSTLSPPKSNQIWPGQRSDSAMPLAPWHRPAEIRNVGVNNWVARPRPSGVSPVGSLKQDSKWFKDVDQTWSNINNGPSDASASDVSDACLLRKRAPWYHFSVPLQ